MLRTTFRVCIVLALLVFAVSAYAEETKIMTEPGKKGKDNWDGSWYGKGGDSEVVVATNNTIPMDATENVVIDLKDYENAVVMFQNSEESAKDVLKIQYTHKPGQDAKGEWGWISYCIAGGVPWGWAPLRVPKECNTVTLTVKGSVGDEEVKFGLSDEADAKTGEINLADFLPAKKITTDWQQAVIPFSSIPDIDKIDLDKVKASCGSVGPEGEHIVYIDNFIFYTAKAE